MERPLSLSATMNSRKRSGSVVLGFQWAWMVPAGTKQAVAGMQRDRRLAVFLPNAGAGQDVEGDCRRMQMSRIGLRREAYCVSQTITSCPGVFGSSLFRSGAWGIAGPFLADHGLGLQRAHARKRRDAEHVGKKSAGQKHPLGWSRASNRRPDIPGQGSQMEASLYAADLSSPPKRNRSLDASSCSTSGYLI